MHRSRLRRLSDTRLLEATAGGDAEAYGEFFARHVDEVLRFARRRIGGSEVAADLTAETFAAALEAVHQGRASDVRNPAAWLMQIASHKLVDSYRHSRVQDAARLSLNMPPLVLDDDDLRWIDRIAANEQGVVSALERLSAQERDAIVARIVQERDYEQIAATGGESQAAVRKRVSRALARLRQDIEAQRQGAGSP